MLRKSMTPSDLGTSKNNISTKVISKTGNPGNTEMRELVDCLEEGRCRNHIIF